jgi:hypothetical protein
MSGISPILHLSIREVVQVSVGQCRVEMEVERSLTRTVILKYAGRDASEKYNSIHAPSLLYDNLDQTNFKGTIDAGEAALDPEWLKPPPSEVPVLQIGVKPPLQTVISSYDFEEVASSTLTAKTWAFYSSAATDLITRDANKSMFDRIWWRPRIMRDVKNVNTRTKMLGCDVDLPIFVSPAAMARLVHPEGEKAMAAGCANNGVAQCVSTAEKVRGTCLVPWLIHDYRSQLMLPFLLAKSLLLRQITLSSSNSTLTKTALRPLLC